MGTILSDLGLESSLVATTVTTHIKDGGPDGFRCTVYDAGTEQARDTHMLRTDTYGLPEGDAPPRLKPGDAMNPVTVTDVEHDDAIVVVEEHQPSGGIGEGGLNARLAERLTGLDVQVVKVGADLRKAMEQLVADQDATARAGAGDAAVEEV